MFMNLVSQSYKDKMEWDAIEIIDDGARAKSCYSRETSSTSSSSHVVTKKSPAMLPGQNRMLRAPILYLLPTYLLRLLVNSASGAACRAFSMSFLRVNVKTGDPSRACRTMVVGSRGRSKLGAPGRPGKLRAVAGVRCFCCCRGEGLHRQPMNRATTRDQRVCLMLEDDCISTLMGLADIWQERFSCFC